MEKQGSADQNAAANIRRLRNAHGWSLAELSHRLEEAGHSLSVPVLSKIELGDRRIDAGDLWALSGVLRSHGVDELLRSPGAVRSEIAARFWRNYLYALERRNEVVAEMDEELEGRAEGIRRVVSDHPEALEALETLVLDHFQDSEEAERILDGILMRGTD